MFYVSHLDCKIYSVSLQRLIEVLGVIAKIYSHAFDVLEHESSRYFNTVRQSTSVDGCEHRVGKVGSVRSGHEYLETRMFAVAKWRCLRMMDQEFTMYKTIELSEGGGCGYAYSQEPSLRCTLDSDICCSLETTCRAFS